MGVEALGDRRAYEQQIERLHQRSLAGGRLYALRQDDVSLASIVLNRAKVARLLAREVSRGRYELEPGVLRTITVRGKARQVFTCRLTDLIVHGVVADIVGQAVAPGLSARVFSYRRGVSPLTPVSELAAYVRAARRSQPDPRSREMYVLRRDIDAYTDSIPLGSTSPLWPMLERALGGPLPPLALQAVRTELRLPGGGTACRLQGLPMGQPIAPVIANLYLGPLDAALEQVPGAFYARYGDDIIFASPDAAVARAADATMDRVLDALSLTANAAKRRTAYLTPAGRPSAAWPQASGAPAVPFLGARIMADGTIGLDAAKARAVLRDVDRRVQTTARTLRGADAEEVGRAVCAVVRGALDPSSALTQQRSAMALRRVVTDRHQLEQLDYAIARMVLQAVTGRRSPRAFRQVPYRTLRDWGLPSLVAARNGAACTVGSRR